MSTLHRRGLILWSLMPAVLFVSKVEVFASPVASPSATSSKPAASLATPKPQRLILWDGDTTLRKVVVTSHPKFSPDPKAMKQLEKGIRGYGRG